MPIKFTTKGFIELWRGATKLSQHTVESEAVERATADYEVTGHSIYTLKYPNKEIDLSRLTRVIRDVDATRPTTPSGFGANPVSATQINLLWTASTDPQGASTEAVTGVAGYRVYRNGSLRTTTTSLSFSDTGLSEYTQYSYYVTAIDGATPPNESVPTGTLSPRTLDTTAPTAPTITATQAGTTAITVALTTPSTDSGSGVATYRLEYKRSVDSTWTLDSAALTSGSFPRTISGLTASTSYDTRCRATDSASNVGSFSSTSTATTQAASGGASELADWQKRSSMTGVVWAHNFDSENEVRQFRNSSGFGIDPDGTQGARVSWISSDGFAGGGCVECLVPSGGTSNGAWTRPMSAIAASNNGKSSADPAANGTVAVQSYNSSSPAVTYNWRKGYYTHPTIQATYPQWPVGTSGVYDGTEFWLSFRVKIQSTRWTAGNPYGKLAFIEVTEGLSNEQEIVVMSLNKTDGASGAPYVSTNPMRMYTSRGSRNNSIIGGTQGAYSGKIEPGGPYDASCVYGNTSTPGACWEYPSEQWTTLLFHVIPGRDNRASIGQPLANWPFNDTTIEVWKCDQGESAWTKVFEHFTLKWEYISSGQSGTNGPNGEWHAPAFNQIAFTAYMNNVPAVSGGGWYQRYTQVILSKDWIPPPGESAPSWWTS